MQSFCFLLVFIAKLFSSFKDILKHDNFVVFIQSPQHNSKETKNFVFVVRIETLLEETCQLLEFRSEETKRPVEDQKAFLVDVLESMQESEIQFSSWRLIEPETFEKKVCEVLRRERRTGDFLLNMSEKECSQAVFDLLHFNKEFANYVADDKEGLCISGFRLSKKAVATTSDQPFVVRPLEISVCYFLIGGLTGLLASYLFFQSPVN